MVDGLILGVAAALRERYGEEAYGVYTESVPQGMRVPAFLIGLKRQVLRSGLGRRFREDDFLEVVYVPASEGDVLAECRGVESSLEGLLSWVKLEDGLVQGREMCGRVEDGRLYFDVRYRFDLYREAEPDVLMQRVTVYGKTDDGDC